MPVPAAGATGDAVTAAPRAASRRSRDWGDADEERPSIARPRKSGGVSPILWIVGGVLALSCVVCMCVGGVGGWWLLARNERRVVVAKADVPKAVVREDMAVVGEDIFLKEPPKDAMKGANKADFMQPPAKEFAKDFKGGIPPGAGRIVFNQQGRLMPNDANRDGKAHKPFQVPFQQGKTYLIDLSSVEMDSYLWLYDPKGIRIAEDDDSGPGFHDARIRITAPQTGNYLIAATYWAGLRPDGATFTLTVREE